MLTGKLHPDILCLQETLRYTGSSRNVIPGYEVIESFANKEEKDGRGLVLAVRCKLDLTLSSVEVHPNFLAGSVCGKKASGGWFKLLVVNVYIPPKCSLYGNRAETLEALGSFLVSENKKNGLDDILVIGDWNMTPEEAARFLAVNNLYCTNKWLFEAPRATRAAALGANRCIDYCLFLKREWAEVVKVHRKWDISDHLPVTVDVRVDTLTRAVRKKKLFLRKFVERSLAEKLISCPTWNSFGHTPNHKIMWQKLLKKRKKLGL
ncbi:hypothetical protein LUQ84_000605 [Hamiltosporidium tvaerminnensis]|nr:hypothetical protein LUQ84_000605 [Hamiltosporidium tvaerminnensis]